MTALLLNFFRSHWLGETVIAAITSAVMLVWVQHLEIAHLREEVREARAMNVTLVTANAALTASIERQNAAIETWKTQGERNAVSAARLSVQAERANVHYRAVVQRIAHEKMADNCAGMAQMVQRYVTPLR